MSGVINILKPTPKKMVLFLILFTSAQLLSLVVYFALVGFWDGGLSIGIPFGFYTLNCGFDVSNTPCPYGMHFDALLLNILFYYLLASIIKRK